MIFKIYLNEKLVKKGTVSEDDKYEIVRDSMTKYLQLDEVFFNEDYTSNSYYCSRCNGFCCYAVEGHDETDEYEADVTATCSWATYYIKSKSSGKELAINFEDEFNEFND